LYRNLKTKYMHSITGTSGSHLDEHLKTFKNVSCNSVRSYFQYAVVRVNNVHESII